MAPVVRNPPANAGDSGGPELVGLIPGSGRSPEIENGKLLQYFCLGNFTDRGAWWAQSIASQRDTTERLSTQVPYILGL